MNQVLLGLFHAGGPVTAVGPVGLPWIGGCWGPLHNSDTGGTILCSITPTPMGKSKGWQLYSATSAGACRVSERDFAGTEVLSVLMTKDSGDASPLSFFRATQLSSIEWPHNWASKWGYFWAWTIHNYSRQWAWTWSILGKWGQVATECLTVYALSKASPKQALVQPFSSLRP